jgi:hypothetical protein
MTDKELLEFAAKAAGIDVGIWTSAYRGTDFGAFETKGPHWNPLNDDGDALRLANELELNMFHVGGNAYAMESESDGSDEQVVSYRDCKDRHEAMRRAIVRTAAEIGKAL